MRMQDAHCMLLQVTLKDPLDLDAMLGSQHSMAEHAAPLCDETDNQLYHYSCTTVGSWSDAGPQ